ncbi:major facilitator superfamily domain-containing protein [Bisporella sp. PMI_857]|nr:major facilitator superfamily domain-containing protein [Bisporella sp. PMI_857]
MLQPEPQGLHVVWSNYLAESAAGNALPDERTTVEYSSSTSSPEHLSWSGSRLRSFFRRRSTLMRSNKTGREDENGLTRPVKWSLGVLNDRKTHEVPGSVLLLAGGHNELLGVRTSLVTGTHPSTPRPSNAGIKSRRESHRSHRSHKSEASERKKLTTDGQIILEPQPDDSPNDPLNWPSWERDMALVSLGLYCMVGGGMTPILAAGFTDVALTYNVTTSRVALTTGLYMMGMGVGSVFASPTAILFGKRPVYLTGVILLIASSIWCASSPHYISLLMARIIQGISVSPVECLPSATIADIYFLHERAFRIGIYTLLLLGGKNLVPLVSAAVMESLSWRWVFWIVAITAGFCAILLFLFVPETFWDRTPSPRGKYTSKHSSWSGFTLFRKRLSSLPNKDLPKQMDGTEQSNGISPYQTPVRSLHVGFAPGTIDDDLEKRDGEPGPLSVHDQPPSDLHSKQPLKLKPSKPPVLELGGLTPVPIPRLHEAQDRVAPQGGAPPTPWLHSINSPFYIEAEYRRSSNYFKDVGSQRASFSTNCGDSCPVQKPLPYEDTPELQRYTSILKERPKLTFVQQLKPYNGRLQPDNWFRIAVRPLILFTYPAVLWSSIVYSCSVGWLIVLSESVAIVYRSQATYSFSALSTGLVYISPLIGGILGTAVAGKVSDLIVQAMSRRNGGLYEPEFRLVMALPITMTTAVGLMGFGWSVQVHDAWAVPTVFFGIISFGCSLGSTTAITFCVDSYRQYAAETLVTLNFSKNIFHGLVFSLFFPAWLESDGSKWVFIWLGIIQLVLMTLTIPMYILGKRARMWTARRNWMERF